MPTYRDEAIVLRTHKLGEADRIITLLCRDHGKVRAVARGVRRTSSRFGGRLEPFSHVDVQLAVGRSLDVVAQAESLHHYGDALVGDYTLYTSGETMLETADRLMVVEKEPSRRQYLLLQGALRVLGRGTSDGSRPASMILGSYLLRALAIAGYAPVLDSCARCGLRGPHEWFAPAAGGMVCNSCRPPGSTRPGPECWALLSALVCGDWPATRGVGEDVERRTAGLVSAFATWHMDHGLRSLRMIPGD
ncbi:DNA repair protein RecO [Propionibacterium acidifaciens F0233]|uniref:DNA repair protein RecO n=1 Tax=Propionibacterium acidifaciens F0233 TaxID=553198 RepID=U2QEW2_9ACTN|nr:DNA repair protein RecO [Propionibacterium acidifaciens]AYW78672.1 DNA repair protein RecO [Propionibacterium acidifaciens]ERK54734.1 DNA repair protein RecO [Propionibacterium acidifaciens F0233]